MTEAELLDKLRKIEALFAGATSTGEREAAERARSRIQERLRTVAVADPPVEYTFTMHDPWSRQLFMALARRYGIKPYRYARQRRSTVMLRVPRSFVDQTLWPEFQQLDAVLRSYLADVTSRVIAAAIHADAGEAEEVSGGALPGA